MAHKLLLSVTMILLGLFLPAGLMAQSDAEPSLGDLARSLRKNKAALEHTVIDNDNLSRVMDEVESHRLNGSLLFSFDATGKTFQVSSPDVTCSLSFNARATSLLTDPYVPQDLPETELAKLDGPAAIHGDTLQVSVFNGTNWNIKEITVGLTLMRQPETDTARHETGRLLPAAEVTPLTTEKRSDVTVLYHLKGSAAPSTTTVFRETLGTTLDAGQDWHWAIVQAKGLPPARQQAPAQ